MIYSRSRWPGLILAATLSIVLALLPVLTMGWPVAAQEGATAAVSVVDFAFEPETLTVSVGTEVTWTNNGQRPHTITADDGSFDSGRLDPGEQFSHVFDQPGNFTYHCGFHPEMVATIVVTEERESALEVATPTADEDSGDGDEPAADSPAADSAAGLGRNLDPIEQSRLAHVHAGTCDELGIVVYSLPDIRTYRVDEANGAGVGAVELIAGSANVALGELFGEPFSIHIHESAQNKGTYLACADVGGRPDAPWSEADGLTLEAREQNGSGYSGFATLRPSVAEGTDIAVVIAASPDSVEAVESQPATASTTYTSPSFRYTIGYGPTWQESENVSSSGHDRFVLFNGKSYITFTGAAAYGGDPDACVDAFVDQLTADPNVSNLDLAVDENGEPLEGGTEATGAFAIYNHDYAFPGRVEPYTLFVGCVPLVPNEAVLAIVQNVPTADYNTEVELREALLRGLTLAQ
jgi:plastocyanin